MDFIIQKGSPLPAHEQIKEQIKVALLFGNLRPGEILPSIRDLESQLNISRNIVRKAYVELEELGILKLIQGKGVMVNKNLKYKEDKEFLGNCERLADTTRKRCKATGLIFSSFARFLHHKAIEIEQQQPPLLYVDVSTNLAKERAERLSEMLRVPVQGRPIDELRELKKNMKPGIKIVCNYYRFEEVSRILRGRKVDIVPLRLIYDEQFKEGLRALPPRSKVMFVSDEREQPRLSLILEDYRREFADRELEFVSGAAKDLNSGVRRLIESEGFSKFLVSNRIWESIPKEIQTSPKVSRPLLEFDPSSIEESKIQLGIIA